MPWHTDTRHIQPFPEIWFETEHFEQNPEIVSKTEKIDFSAKFAWKLKFHGNQGKFSLTQWF